MAKPARKSKIFDKAKVKTKAKTKAKPPAKASPPDWLRKAMAVKAPTRAKTGRKPNALKAKFKAITAKARRGKKPMATKPYDPTDDPDFRAGVKGDVPVVDPKPPGSGLKPGQGLPDAPSTKPVDPRPGAPKPLPGGGVAPDNALPEPEEPETFDEVQSGGDIPDENIQMLIAGTLGGSGDNHASAKRIVERMHQAEWVVTKALDAGSGDTRKGGKKGREDDAKARKT